MSSRGHHRKGRIESWLDSMDPFHGVYHTSGLVVLGLAAFGLIGSLVLWWRFGDVFIADVQKWFPF